MIHTADLSIFPTKEVYERFMQYNGTRWNKKEKVWINSTLLESGFTWIKGKIISKPDFQTYHLKINLNLSKLVLGDEHVQLITAGQIEAVEQRFNEVIDSLGIGLPHLREWSLVRCDYCMNIKTPYVKEYVKILQHGDVPKGLRRKPNDQRNYVTHRAGGVYLIAGTEENPNITINFYDKQFEMICTDHPAEQIAQAQDVLRLEVQCMRVKINSIIKSEKYEEVTGHTLLDFLNPEVSYVIIQYYLSRVVKDATFQRLPVAHKMIDELSCRNEKKELLHSLIDTIATQYGSVKKAKDYFGTQGKAAKEIDSCIRYLAEKDINAVTISPNQTIKGKKRTAGLDSIHSLLDHAFMTEYMSI